MNLTLDLKAVARKFQKRPAATAVAPSSSAIGGLRPYILQTLFLPMVTTGEISAGSLDFALISEEDIHSLRAALEESTAIELLACAEHFAAMPPAARTAPIFM